MLDSADLGPQHVRQDMGRAWVHKMDVGPSISQKCARESWNVHAPSATDRDEEGCLRRSMLPQLLESENQDPAYGRLSCRAAALNSCPQSPRGCGSRGVDKVAQAALRRRKIMYSGKVLLTVKSMFSYHLPPVIVPLSRSALGADAIGKMVC